MAPVAFRFAESCYLMKTTILWDHDGVLVETEPWYFKATQSCISALGVELEKPDYLADMAVGRSAWERARKLGASSDEIAHHKSRRDACYQEYLRTEDIEIVGVEEVLADLGGDFQMAIVTTAKRSDFELIHRDRSIAAHMSFVLCSGEYPRAKPHPDPYLAALDRFGVSRTEAVVIEDSERGLRSAVAAGIDCVVVANDFVRGQNLEAATHQIDSLSDLPALLRTLRR